MTKKLKIDIISSLPAFARYKGKGETGIIRGPNLTLPHLAALTPGIDDDVEVRITDELCETIDMDTDADLIGISANTCSVNHAFDIAHEYRSKGKTVVIGGTHATIRPDDCLPHADAVVVGEAEETWPQIVNEFKKAGKLSKKKYECLVPPNLDSLPIPRRYLFKGGRMLVDSMQTTRGCIHSCSYCVIGKINGKGFRQRPVDRIIEEMKTIKSKYIVFWDDNILANNKVSKHLFREMIPLKKKWLSQLTVNVAKDKEMLDLVEKSGCAGVFIGVESVNQKSLNGVNKNFNKVQDYKEKIKILHDRGILVTAGIMLGFDEDDPSIFERTMEVLHEIKIDSAGIVICTPIPGTRLYDQYIKEGRIIDHNWDHYDTNNVIFKPRLMTPEQLQEGYHWLKHEFYSYKNIISRNLRSCVNIYNIPYNLAHRSINKRTTYGKGYNPNKKYN
jgi:radical SAM superfamily enzyme YgiQ (UPF0313 family)